MLHIPPEVVAKAREMELFSMPAALVQYLDEHPYPQGGAAARQQFYGTAGGRYDQSITAEKFIQKRRRRATPKKKSIRRK